MSKKQNLHEHKKVSARLGTFLFLIFLATVAGGLSPVYSAVITPEDSVRAAAIIAEYSESGGEPGSLTAPIALSFIGTPAGAVSGRDKSGQLSVSLGEVDPLSFINVVGALAVVSTSPGNKGVSDLLEVADRLGCRRGEWKGFPSQMLYGADWAGDNRARGNIRELTEDYSTQYRTKSLDGITRRRGEYPALSDSVAFDTQKMIEMGFRSHKIPHMKREDSGRPNVVEEMRSGDIVMLLGNDPDFDFVDMGIVVRRPDGFHLIHPSGEAGKVVEEEIPLPRYIKKNAARIYGWRWFRLK